MESQFQYARAVCSDTAACDDIKRTRQELVLLQYREMGDENFMIAFSLAVPCVCVSEFEIPTVWGFQGINGLCSLGSTYTSAERFMEDEKDLVARQD